MKIPIPHSITMVKPSWLRHHVILNDKQGLFRDYMLALNDTSAVTDAQLAEFKAKTTVIQLPEVKPKPIFKLLG